MLLMISSYPRINQRFLDINRFHLLMATISGSFSTISCSRWTHSCSSRRRSGLRRWNQFCFLSRCSSTWLILLSCCLLSSFISFIILLRSIIVRYIMPTALLSLLLCLHVRPTGGWLLFEIFWFSFSGMVPIFVFLI